MNNFKGIPKLKIEDGNKNIILLIIITYNKSEELSQENYSHILSSFSI